MTGHATLICDVPARVPYRGSCGIVARSLTHSLRRHDHAVRELWVPLSDKHSAISLPRRRSASAEGVHLFFEELFARCVRDAEFQRWPSVVFFNLPHFRFPEQCEADGLIFNSKYLMDCFRHEAFARNLALPPMTCAPLELPLHAFPDGYPSPGNRLARKLIGDLADQVHLGHALRPGKADRFATLSIMHHLNQMAIACATKPFLLMISARDRPDFEQTLRDMPIPAETLESLLPVPHLTNRSLVSVMRHSKFGLCHDTFVEAFGFYPVESVYSGCPVFTNGAANLRHLLPARSGIEVQDDFAMHFGPLDERVEAYRAVAERVFRVVMAGEGPALCERGARYIDRHYCQAAFSERVGRLLSQARRFHRSKPGRRGHDQPGRAAQVSPYLRLADWKHGRFVTDLGNVEVAADVAAEWQRVLSSSAPPRDTSGPAIPLCIGAVRPDAA